MALMRKNRVVFAFKARLGKYEGQDPTLGELEFGEFIFLGA